MKGLSKVFPNGCSDKQRKEFRDKVLGDKTSSDFYREATDEERCMEEELSMLDMLSSCFAYGGVDSFFHTWSFIDSYYNDYLKDYLKEGGSKKEFDKMIEIQRKHYERCSVIKNVYTDSEGCTYNSIREIDEKVNW